jgi:hypothetical protein
MFGFYGLFVQQLRRKFSAELLGVSRVRACARATVGLDGTKAGTAAGAQDKKH